MQVSNPPRIAQLSAHDLFDALTVSEKLHAHYLAQAAWLGTRIILQQVSLEAPAIFDFILELYRACAGRWQELCQKTGTSKEEVNAFLVYAATFLHNLGNFYGHGDQKFVPSVSRTALERLSKISAKASKLHSQFSAYIFSPQPSILGYSSPFCQSTYYLGEPMSVEEIAAVNEAMESNDLLPEHTRIRKSLTSNGPLYELLYASVEIRSPSTLHHERLGDIHIVSGDFSAELSKICEALLLACEHAASATQREYLSMLVESLMTGDMKSYKASQILWVQSKSPTVETIFGFVEPYRDPHGVRAEFEGLVGIVHQGETQLLDKIVRNADKFVQSFPWACSSSSRTDDNGPFESIAVGHRNFASLHTLAYCSSLIFPGINLPNFNDIRQNTGFKNLMIMNRIDGSPMAGDSQAAYIQAHEAEQFLSNRKQVYYLWVVFHELFGHGTGRFLAETEPGIYNFDMEHRPIDPTTAKPITSWYRYGQTWTGVFGDIATRVDECRAECIGAILISNQELMALCGVTTTSNPSLDELEYNMYLQLAVAGLRSLENYTPGEERWGQAHSQGHWAMFRAILEHGSGLLSVHHDSLDGTLSLSVDQSKISTNGKPILDDLALKLHIYRCTADVEACREYFNEITKVDAMYLEWREIVVRARPPSSILIQPNTRLAGDAVVLKEYEATLEGMVQSWAERDV